MLGGVFLSCRPKRKNWWELVARLYTLGESNSIYPVFSLGSSLFFFRFTLETIVSEERGKHSKNMQAQTAVPQKS